ncbi:MAG: ATP-binding cassette domain-containing protein [Candidatus Protochlamydia sp.]|nr:ATP-binding cassette domain-containing protein [Candidatus Protochlamydia sp.]
MRTLNFIAFFLRPYWRRILFVIALLTIEVAFYSFFTYSIQFIISALANRQIERLTYLFYYLFLGSILAVGSSLWRCFFYSNLSSDIIGDLRMKVFTAIQQLSIGQLVEREASKLLVRFQEVDFVGAALAVIDKTVIYSLLSFFSSLFLLSIINIELTAVALMLVPFLFLVPKIVVPKINSLGDERETEEHLSAFALENILLQPIIRIFGLQKKQKKIFEAKNLQACKKYSRIQFLNSLASSSADIMPIVLRITVFAIGSYFVFSQNFNIAALVSFEFVFSQLIYSIIRIFYSLPTVTLGYAALKSVQKILNKKNENEKKTKVVQSKITSPNVRFKNVFFGYDPKNLNISNLNFEIPYKSQVAFVGSNGSGKSTLINLLLNFYTPSSGSIEINGINLEQLNKEDLYKVIGYVSQEAQLFDTTIKENIRLGKPNATDQEIEIAAKKAELDHAIHLMPNKYQTVVGFRGSRLSGGQKQRVALARALIRSPEILLLDEITASLDPVSEAAINKTIEEIAKDCTVIVVAHHLACVMNADCIYVLDQGAIREFGTHQQLLDKKGIYQGMWNKQNGFIEGKLDSILISIERLKKIPLFFGIPEDSLELIRHQLRMITYPKNMVIYRHGDIGDMFYILIRGSIEIIKVDKEQKKSWEVLEDGDYFGERSIASRTATAMTITPCLVLAFSVFDLNSIIDLNPLVRERLEKRMSQ